MGAVPAAAKPAPGVPLEAAGSQSPETCVFGRSVASGQARRRGLGKSVLWIGYAIFA